MLHRRSRLRVLGSLEYVKAGGSAVLIFLRRVSPGDVRAAWLRPVWIAGECVSAGARAAANLSKLALAALAFEVRGVAQSAKQIRFTIDGFELLLADISGRKG